MTDYEKCERAYKLGAGPDKLRIWVKAGKITAEEFEQITGEAYNSEG